MSSTIQEDIEYTEFLSCLCGSERPLPASRSNHIFLSCLCGSELETGTHINSLVF